MVSCKFSLKPIQSQFLCRKKPVRSSGSPAAPGTISGRCPIHLRAVAVPAKWPYIGHTRPGKLWKDPPFFIGKLTISVAIFNRYQLPEVFFVSESNVQATCPGPSSKVVTHWPRPNNPSASFVFTRRSVEVENQV
jgi:hypothetical protein